MMDLEKKSDFVSLNNCAPRSIISNMAEGLD